MGHSHNGFSLRLVYSALLSAFTAAESYYNGFDLYSATDKNYTSSVNECVAWCLDSVSCIAVSVCSSSTQVLCSLSNCGNVQVVASSRCTLILFTDLVFLNNSVPSAVQEWIMTDSCGSDNYSYPNTGMDADATLNVAVTGSDIGSPTLAASASSFYGNAVSGAGLSISASISISNPVALSVFYWFKYLKQTNDTFKLAELTFMPTTNSWVLSFRQNGTSFMLHNLSNDCPLSGCLYNVANQITSEIWHNAAITYSNNLSTATFFLDGVERWSQPLAIPLVNVSSVSIYTGPMNSSDANIAFYCYKIYNVSLSSNDVNKIAKSCLAGEIREVIDNDNDTDADEDTAMDDLTETNVSLSQWQKLFPICASGRNKKIQNLTQFCGISSGTRVTWQRAQNYCRSIGFQLAQPFENSDKKPLANLLKSLATKDKNYWIGAQYSAASSTYVWTNMNTVLPWECKISNKNTLLFTDYPYASFRNKGCNGKRQFSLLRNFACSV